MNSTAIAVIISFFGYILYGAAGFGAAMIFHSLWTLLEIFDVTSGSVKEATYYLNIMTLFVTLIMSVNNRKLIQWSFVGVVVIPWTAMNVVGCYCITNVSNKLLKFILGIILFIIFLQQSVRVLSDMLSGKMLSDKLSAKKEKQSGKSQIGEEEIPFVNLRKNWLWLAFVSVFGGILSGLFNMPGPSTIIVLLFSDIHRERWKANFFTWQIPAQIFVVWYLSDVADLFEADQWYWYIIMIVVSMISSKIGNYVAGFLDKTTFVFIVISISLLGALSDISVYFPDQTNLIIVIGFSFAILMMLCLFTLLHYRVNIPYREITQSQKYHSLQASESRTRAISSENPPKSGSNILGLLNDPNMGYEKQDSAGDQTSVIVKTDA